MKIILGLLMLITLFLLGWALWILYSHFGRKKVGIRVLDRQLESLQKKKDIFEANSEIEMEGLIQKYNSLKDSLDEEYQQKKEILQNNLNSAIVSLEESLKKQISLQQSLQIEKIKNTKNELNHLNENVLVKETQIEALRRTFSSKVEELNNEYLKKTQELSKDYKRDVEKQEKELSNRIEMFRAALQKEYKAILTKEKEKLKQEKDGLLQELSAAKMAHENEMQVIKASLEDLKAKESAAILARIYEYEQSNLNDFGRIIVGDKLTDLSLLQSILPQLKNETPLRKAIYDYYYKEPIKDMINLVTGGRRISGIYKITHMASGKCYVGQSVDIGNRFAQHCKRGAGVDVPTSSKLYPEMLECGLEEFKFQIVEEMEENKAKMNEREKYWGEYFGSKVFGYSIKN